MLQSKTWIAVGAMVVIGGLAWMTLRAPEKGEHAGPRERPIAALKAADIKELELASAGGKDHVTLKFDGGRWMMTAPASNPADQALIKTATEQLEKITYGDLVTEKKEKAADLEVSDDKGAHVIAKDAGGKPLFDAWIGKSVSGFTMIRPGGTDKVWQASGLYKYTYARDAKSWRDHTIFTFSKDDVARLTVEANGQKLALEKLPPAEKKDDAAPAAPAPESHWKVLEATVKVDPLDDNVANQMVSTLASMSAADFDDAIQAADAGTTAPRFKVTVALKGGLQSTLLVGKTKGDDNWVQVEGKPQIFLMHKYALERVNQKPIDFRDKTIVKAKDDDLTAIDLVVGEDKYTLEHGATWKFGKGTKGELDEAKAKPIASAFDNLAGASFAEVSDPKETGLARPTATATLHLRDKSTVQIKVGAASKDGTESYVQKAGSPDVMMVKKFAVDRFMKKLADITKK